jgi:hypothetical protein
MVRIQVTGQATIDAPASKVWGVLAHDFANIGRWATLIPDSREDAGTAAPEGAVVGGRVCSNSIPGFADVREEFTIYSEQSMRFSYKATEGMPSVVKSAENSWTVRSIGPSQSVVEARGEVHMSLIPGLFLAPLMKFQLGRMAHQTGEELKYFIEQGQPHPRKLKAQRKQMQQSSAET